MENMEMQKSAYMAAQNEIIELGKRASVLNLDSFLRAINQAETLAPMLDPILYIKGSSNLKAVKNLAESFLAVQNAYHALVGVVLNTAMREEKL